MTHGKHMTDQTGIISISILSWPSPSTTNLLSPSSTSQHLSSHLPFTSHLTPSNQPFHLHVTSHFDTDRLSSHLASLPSSCYPLPVFLLLIPHLLTSPSIHLSFLSLFLPWPYFLHFLLHLLRPLPSSSWLLSLFLSQKSVPSPLTLSWSDLPLFLLPYP